MSGAGLVQGYRDRPAEAGLVNCLPRASVIPWAAERAAAVPAAMVVGAGCRTQTGVPRRRTAGTAAIPVKALVADFSSAQKVWKGVG